MLGPFINFTQHHNSMPILINMERVVDIVAAREGAYISYAPHEPDKDMVSMHVKESFSEIRFALTSMGKVFTPGIDRDEQLDKLEDWLERERETV